MQSPLTPWQQVLKYEQAHAKNKPLPSSAEFLKICENEYIDQAGNHPDMHTKLLGMVKEHLYLESHRPAMNRLLNQTKLLLESKIERGY